MNALSLKSIAALTTLGAVLCAASATVSADEACTEANAQLITAPANAPTVTVSYRDLNLASAAGHRALVDRITAAARQVCTDEGVRGLDAFAASRACQAQAVSAALYQVQLAHPMPTYAVNLHRG